MLFIEKAFFRVKCNWINRYYKVEQFEHTKKQSKITFREKHVFSLVSHVS